MSRMDADQLWAVRVVAATERRLRTHYAREPGEQSLPPAQQWALENVT